MMEPGESNNVTELVETMEELSTKQWKEAGDGHKDARGHDGIAIGDAGL